MTSRKGNTLELPAEDWTIVGAFRRGAGPGPLVESVDGNLEVGFDHDGLLACRVGRDVRVMHLETSSIADRWATLMLRKSGPQVEFRVDGEVMDSWACESVMRSDGMRLMRDVDGGMRDLMVYAEAVSDEEAAKILEYIEGQKDAAYVEFRRGGAPRFRSDGR